MIAAGAFAELAEAIMRLHYDPAYDRSRGKHPRPRLAAVPVVPTDEASRAGAATAIVRLLASLTPSPRGATLESEQ